MTGSYRADRDSRGTDRLNQAGLGERGEGNASGIFEYRS